jgi:hypothetical protein
MCEENLGVYFTTARGNSLNYRAGMEEMVE